MTKTDGLFSSERTCHSICQLSIVLVFDHCGRPLTMAKRHAFSLLNSRRRRSVQSARRTHSLSTIIITAMRQPVSTHPYSPTINNVAINDLYNCNGSKSNVVSSLTTCITFTSSRGKSVTGTIISLQCTAPPQFPSFNLILYLFTVTAVLFIVKMSLVPALAQLAPSSAPVVPPRTRMDLLLLLLPFPRSIAWVTCS